MNVTTLMRRDVAGKFESAELTGRAVALQGWAVSGAGDAVRAALGPDARSEDLAVAAGAWTSAEKPDSAHALGPVRSVVVLTTTGEATVRIAMGSQAWAPEAGATPSAWGVRLRAGEQLLVDGRCSFQVGGGDVAVALWTAA